MANWLTTVTGSLKAASESVQKLMELREFVKHGDALGKLQAQILAAQQIASSAFARETDMAEEIRSLKTQVTELQEWNAEEQRYHLVALAPHVTAQAIKEGMRGAEPEHYLCTKCFTDRKKGYLQAITLGPYYDKYRCNRCGDELHINKGTPRVQRKPATGGWT